MVKAQIYLKTDYKWCAIRENAHSTFIRMFKTVTIIQCQTQQYTISIQQMLNYSFYRRDFSHIIMHMHKKEKTRKLYTKILSSAISRI